MHRLIVRTIEALAFLAAAANAADDETRLLRFPTIHGDRVVFTYAGDLYTVSAEGGIARRLTSHDGYEMFARFSPDGKRLAFTGQYDGNTEVYVMPAEGGSPKRLTFTATLDRDFVHDRMGPNNIVMCWKNDGSQIIFRSRMREFNDFKGQLFAVSVDGGLPEQLPLPRGGFCSFSPDDSKLAYNRVFREFRTWKRYRGGQADEIWIYDFAAKTTEKLTDNPAQDIIPMWAKDRVYFISDRDADGTERMNLYSVDLRTKETKRHTNFTEFDVKFPSIGNKAIVFENGGYLYRFDLATEQTRKVPVRIREDLAGARGGLTAVGKNVANFDVAPDGKRAVFSARGDVYTVPAKEGPTRNLTSTVGVHERGARWSPDGKWIAYISDASGDNEIHVAPQSGGPAKQVTKDADTYKWAIDWSPDSKKILWSDKKLRLQFVEIESGKTTNVAQAKAGEITSFDWSPDSRWIAYSQPEENQMSRIYLYSVESGKTHPVTSEWYRSYGPAFSNDGKYLFFVSDRDFNPTFGATEWNHIYQNMSRVYFVTLAKAVKSPFEPKSDEVEIKTEETPKPSPPTEASFADPQTRRFEPKDSRDNEDKKADSKQDKSKADAKKADAEKTDAKKKPVNVVVDVDGLMDRILVLPGPPGNYGGISTADGKVFYFRIGSGSRPPGATGGFSLFVYDFTKKAETSLGTVSGYQISADRKKMLVARDGAYAIIDLPAGEIQLREPMNLAGMETSIDRRAEWDQIFHECWRQMRDFFYDPNMHGVDWKAMREKYAVLLPHVAHRADLTYVIGEMISELNCGHAYIGGGEVPSPKRVPMGLLGAVVKRDETSKFFRIEKILPGENWDRRTRSPLTEVGVDAGVGDYILAVEGKPVNQVNNIQELLINTAGKPVRLKLNSKPEEAGAREVTVVPTANEQPLYYLEWVHGNIRKVSDATNGKVGYLHIPDMLADGLNEFAKRYYPQLRKQALIIDVRGNGGGNVSPQIIERLQRQLAMVSVARNTTPNTNPGGMLLGPKVVLMDEFSASDGDLFPYRFKHYKLGKVIGKRSWGGVVGIRGPLPMIDGSDLRKPEFAPYDVEGKQWIIEGYGVDPDIVVDNDPAREFAGVDDQLTKAIEVVLEELKTQEKTLPPLPPFPIKK